MQQLQQSHRAGPQPTCVSSPLTAATASLALSLTNAAVWLSLVVGAAGCSPPGWSMVLLDALPCSPAQSRCLRPAGRLKPGAQAIKARRRGLACECAGGVWRAAVARLLPQGCCLSTEIDPGPGWAQCHRCHSEVPSPCYDGDAQKECNPAQPASCEDLAEQAKAPQQQRRRSNPDCCRQHAARGKFGTNHYTPTAAPCTPTIISAGAAACMQPASTGAPLPRPTRRASEMLQMPANHAPAPFDCTVLARTHAHTPRHNQRRLPALSAFTPRRSLAH